MEIGSLFERINWELIIGMLILPLEMVYAAFAFIMVRHIQIMNTTFTTKLAPFFNAAARVHFVAILILIVISIFFLII